ncbi:type II toxin-antitoxin system RatA family toxin [Hymenobacter lapidiphilus]|uniref:SRPBCC family protein n=1 Tax=Hymenobacter lapidiphilus TaxID=2608003 RepID=A0A7Y7PPY7_9BACT|nr:SRPBCC family protein [Hymenobacter lapidiphilus]NVO31744.1 SRPBCC family protein [Hymenobacter lapidiphilus]
MRQFKFTESIQIARPQQEVFDYTQDYGQRLKWDTFLREAVLLDGATEAGLGVKSWCVSKHGIGMETEYVSFNSPRVAAVKLTRPAGLFQAFAGSWRFEALSPDLTNATFTYSFALRGPLRLFSPLASYVLQLNVRGRLRDLKQMLEQST